MVINIIGKSQMWCLIYWNTNWSFLCDESPNEDSEYNSHVYREELFKCVQHEESPRLIEKKNPCPFNDVTFASQRLNNQEGLNHLWSSQLAYNCGDVMNHQAHLTSWIQKNCSIYYAPTHFNHEGDKNVAHNIYLLFDNHCTSLDFLQ